MLKVLRHAVSIVLQNDKGETLFALRLPTASSYPSIWSLPSHYVDDDESFEETAIRIGRDKLGVELLPIKLLNEGESDREGFRLFMHDYLVELKSGEVRCNPEAYVELKWEKPKAQFASMNVMGDCCRLYKEHLEKL